MNPSIKNDFFEDLLKQLIFFDEESALLLDKYFPKYDRDREEIKQLMNRYRDRLEQITKDILANIMPTTVLIGSQIDVRNSEDGFKETYTLVLPGHSDMDQNLISFLSPIGRKLLLANLGDTITAQTPSGHYELTILAIKLPFALARDTTA